MNPDNAFPPSDFHLPEWQQLYESALLEFDKNKLSGRVQAAESAMNNRLASIAGDSDQHAEREAIESALFGLNYLKRELAEYSRSAA